MFAVGPTLEADFRQQNRDSHVLCSLLCIVVDLRFNVLVSIILIKPI